MPGALLLPRLLPQHTHQQGQRSATQQARGAAPMGTVWLAAHLSPARRTSMPGCAAVASRVTSTGLVGGMAGRATCSNVPSNNRPAGSTSW